MRTFRAGFLFCGLGAGARGFLDARASLGSDAAAFECVGGIDNDPDACADFEYLTGGKATCADVSKMQPFELRAAWGDTAPDCVFLSAPCKGFSGLLSAAQASSPKYQALNRLVLEGLFLMTETWQRPPGLIVFENVPLIRTRGKDLLLKAKVLLQQYGYAFHEATHECGELGGLGQIRRRYLLVARLPEAVPAYVYRPPKQRVKACGEILQQLPIPGDPAAGALHALPRISWLNWLRLALIPAGGDWRDLPGMSPERRAGAMGVTEWTEPSATVVGESYPTNGSASVADPRVPGLENPVPEGAERRSVFARHDVRPWDQPARTVAGSGSNGGVAVADPRIPLSTGPAAHTNIMAVTPWDDPTRTVTGAARPGAGSLSVADPRGPELAAAVAMPTGKAWGKENKPQLMGVGRWDQPSNAVTGKASISGGNARAAVADPRVTDLSPNPTRHRNKYAVGGWEEPSATVTGSTRPGSGAVSVADPREPFRGTYGVIDWREPAPTVRGAQRPSQGAVAVSDPRFTCTTLRNGMYGVLSWQQAAYAVTGNARIDNGMFAVSDPRGAELPPELKIQDPKKDKPDFIPVIIAADGSWHRPLTTLELAALQGIPARVNGAPLQLAGKAVGKWRERIGNAVPVQAAQAIAETFLRALLAAALGTWTLGSTGIWVRDDGVTEDDAIEAFEGMQA